MTDSPTNTPTLVPHAVAAAGPAAVAAWEDFAAGSGLQRSTRSLYVSTARRFLRWFDGTGILLAQLTPQAVDEFLIGLGASSYSTRQYRGVLRRFFEALVARGVLHTNPVAPDARRHRRAVSLAELKAVVREIDRTLEEDGELFDAGLVLLAGVMLGTSQVLPISQFTNVRPGRVAEFAKRLRANGVWTADGQTACEWGDEAAGAVGFIIDILIAAGLAERRGEDDTLHAVSPGEQAPAAGE